MKRIRFSNRRALLVLVGSAAVLVLVGALTPAVADPTGAGLGAFGLFDMADSHGLKVSQYELSVDTGGITDPFKMFLAARLLTGWNVYRYSISIMAYLLDWTVNMSWLGAITGPLEHISTLLKDRILTPSGIVAFLLAVSAVVGGTRMIFGRMGKGLWDVASACIVAALVTGALASPVAKYTGEPLDKARNVGVSLATMIVNNDDASMASPDQKPAQLEVGKVLVDAMIRPAHGLVNYGVNFTGGQACTGAYDKALRAGPYWDPGANDTREAVGSCNKKLGGFADNAIYTASASLGVFLVSGVLICALILVVCALLFLAVMMLAWNLLKLVVTAVIGIGPGDTKGPMLHNAAQALVSLVYVASGMVALATIVALIKGAFASEATAPIVRFILADLVIISGFVIVVQTWTAHRRGASSWADKMLTRLKQSSPKPTVGSKVGNWLKGPVGGQASVYGGMDGGSGGTGSGGTGSGVRRAAGAGMTLARMARPVTNSNAFALARFAVPRPPPAGLARSSARSPQPAASAQTAGFANNIRRTVNARSAGARHAGTGHGWVDSTLDTSSRAHNWLSTKTVQAHQRGFDTLERTGQKVRQQAPAAVLSAVTSVVGPRIDTTAPPQQTTRSQALDPSATSAPRGAGDRRSGSTPATRPATGRVPSTTKAPRTAAAAAPASDAASRVLNLVAQPPAARRGPQAPRPAGVTDDLLPATCEAVMTSPAAKRGRREALRAAPDRRGRARRRPGRRRRAPDPPAPTRPVRVRLASAPVPSKVTTTAERPQRRQEPSRRRLQSSAPKNDGTGTRQALGPCLPDPRQPGRRPLADADRRAQHPRASRTAQGSRTRPSGPGTS